ncbi:MAG: tetratricopeptide repeat protein [Candidatus Cyclobacteriaceae bacterium M3_2C_046]
MYLFQNCATDKEGKTKAVSDSSQEEWIHLTDADYIGTESCRPCHQDQFNNWLGSHHDEAMMMADSTSVKGDFNNITFVSQGVISSFFRKDGKYFVNTEGPDGNNQDYEIIYTFGITPLQQYIVEFPDGRYQCLRVAWDTEKKKWFDLYPDFKVASDEWLHWTRGGLNWNTMCSDCHSTNVHKNFDEETGTFNTTYSIINVSCEACHGPGKAHLEYITSGEYQPGDTYQADHHLHLTSNLSSEEQVDQCARCHSRRVQYTPAYNHQGTFMDHYAPEILRDNLYFPDGQILEEDYVYSSFVQSKMYQQGVKCSNCHDPHSLQLKAIGNDLCSQCHDPQVFDTPDHHFHPLKTESAQCVSCHMTGRVYMGNDFRRDHSFRIPRPDLSINYENPNACNQCHTDQTPVWAANAVEEWYGEIRKPNYAEVLSLGSTRSEAAINPLINLVKDQSQAAIVRATGIWYLSQMASQDGMQTILASLTSEFPIIRYTSVNALIDLPAQQKVKHIGPLLDDTVRIVRIAAANALADVPEVQMDQEMQANHQAALSEYRKSLSIRADFPGGEFEKGQFFDRRGQAHLAEKSYLKALEMDNLFNPARVNLAHLYNRENQNDKAIELFKTIIQLEPTYGPAYYSLGLLYAEEQKMAEAVDYLAQAAQISGNNPRIYYNLGLALQQTNQEDKAEQAYLDGLQLDPDSPDLQNALAIMYIQQEQYAKAKAYVDRLIEMFPNNAQLQQMQQVVIQGLRGG